MSKFVLSMAVVCVICGCVSLTFQEQQELAQLQYRGITVDRASGGWQKPASPLSAGLLNILPGGGNFYLASGNAGDSAQWTYGFLNLLTWPISILWESLRLLLMLIQLINAICLIFINMAMGIICYIVWSGKVMKNLAIGKIYQVILIIIKCKGRDINILIKSGIIKLFL